MMIRQAPALFSVVLLAAACTGSGNPDDPSPTPTQATGAPEIVSASASTSRLEPKESVTFTVEIFDPDGADTIEGGTLLVPGAAEYGIFTPVPGSDRWVLTLNWNKINFVEPIYTEVTGTTRSFDVVFRDVDGHEAYATVELLLDCAGGLESACAGQCLTLGSDPENCGQCGRVCSGERPSFAVDASIVADQCNAGSCSWTVETDARVSCEVLCDQAELTCQTGDVGLVWTTVYNECVEDPDNSAVCGLYTWDSGSCGSQNPVALQGGACQTVLDTWEQVGSCWYRHDKQQCHCQ
jgi:hypothetical protein